MSAETSFVVQKLAAGRVRFDLRLELDGVLLSWAVPRGPSADPTEERLAVRVEDRPLEYGGFEGTLTERGAAVMVWDRGTWRPEGDPRTGLEAGRLSFALHGVRLRGRWILVRTGSGQDWLLLKRRDEHAEPGVDLVGEHLTSVISGRPLERIAEDGDRTWIPGGEVPTEAALSRVPGARQGAVPWPLAPELATARSQAPGDEGWLHEIEICGHRLLARAKGGEVSLITRSGEDRTARFPAIAAGVRGLAVDVILDGELAAPGADGRPSPAALRQAMASGRGLQLYVFDLIEARGFDLREAPLSTRKDLLARVVGRDGTGPLRVVGHVVGPGPPVWKAACALGARGIVSRRTSAPYRSGPSEDRIEARCRVRAEFVVIGFEARSEGLSALLLAERTGGGLRFAGRAEAGIAETDRVALRRRLDPLVRETPPAGVSRAPRHGAVHWVEPELYVEIGFTERARAGLLRDASFLGVREGCREAPRVSHPDRVLYPDLGLTKGQLAGWVAEMATLLLPHVAERPLSLVRCPDGLGEGCFFQRHRGSAPASVLPVSVPGQDEPYLMVRDAEGLVGLVQMGAIELHPWSARAGDLEHPDRLILDLDPDEALPFAEVVRAAVEVRDRLAELGLASFVRWTGGKGLHVVAPLAPRAGQDAVEELARRVAHRMARDAPDRYVARAAKDERAGRVFVDWLRNSAGASAIATWSARARPGAPVAAPLRWADLTPDLDRSGLAVCRLSPPATDPWEGFFELDQAVTRAMVDRS